MAGNNGYVGAPYNFIGLSKKVNHVEKENLQAHNVISTELKSGRIQYEIEEIGRASCRERVLAGG